MNDSTMQNELGQLFMEAWILAGYELISGNEVDGCLNLDFYDANITCQDERIIKGEDVHPQLKETLKATAKAAYPTIVPMLKILKKEGEENEV